MLVQNHYDSDIRVRRKAEALVAAGYSVDVLALQGASANSPRNYTLEGVNVFTISLGKKRGSLVRYFYEYTAFFCWAFFKLFRRMGNRRYAVIDVNTLPDFLVFAGAYAKWRGAKIVFDMHEITPEFYISKYGIKEDSRLVRFLKWIERISFNFADHVITINQPIQALLEARGLPASKSTIIMNSADDALFAAPARSSALGKAAASRPQFVMMYHGTLTRIYGVDIAIEAFAKALPEMPGAEFWILGSGPEKSALQVLSRQLGLGDKVKLLGAVPPHEIPVWLSQCDVGVLATRRDIFLEFSFSNKLPEYIINNKPVIASGLKTIRHYFSGESLAFFEPNNPADLARQMVRVHADAGLRKRLAENAVREYAPINWSVMKDRYLEMMGTLTGAGSPARKTPATAVAFEQVR
jgi:glycosyltransferase involved in cell wall biosynthesis